MNNLNRYLEEKDGDVLNASYDLSENKDHAALTIARYENDIIRVLSVIHDEDAKIMYRLLKGIRPTIEEIVFLLEKYSSLRDIAIISGKLREYVKSKAGSQLTIAYLENGSLLRSGSNYGN